MNKLNVGSGQDIRKGWINLDQNDKNGADLIFDLEQIYEGIQIPIKDHSLNYIYCSHVLEDFSDPMPIMKEFIRMSKVKGIIEIIVPHATDFEHSIYHKRPFSMISLKRLSKGNPAYGDKEALDILESKYIICESKRFSMRVYKNLYITLCNYLPEYIVERTFFKYLFPHKFLQIKLIKVHNLEVKE